MLVLASASPRRQELLRNARIAFVVRPADIPEVRLDHEPPKHFAERLARDKALAVFRQLAAAEPTLALNSAAQGRVTNIKGGGANSEQGGATLGPNMFVLGADTIVVVDGQVLGKPQDEQDAFRMLRLLSGRTHEVTTGVCLMGEGVEEVRSETTSVTFDELATDDILGYIATGEPMDKAGAYAIQGIASRWIPRVEGDYGNVVGLPVALVCRMLREQGAI